MAESTSRNPTRSSTAVSAVVLAAGNSRRLGRPKQLLPFQGSTLLGVTLDRVRSFPVDQRIVTVGGTAGKVRATVDFAGFDVAKSLHHAHGCSSSIVAALDLVDPRSSGILLLLGDQPLVLESTVRAVVDAADQASIVVCRYRDGIGHPFWFGRETFAALADLHGDKAVWAVIESGRFPVREIEIDGDVPLDVDTMDDYQRLLDADRIGGR